MVTQTMTTPGIGTCDRCGEVQWVDHLIRQRVAWSHYGCGGTLDMRQIQGKESTTECDGRCWNATGYRCVCSCAGTNHGSGHPPVVLEKEIAASGRAQDQQPLQNIPEPMEQPAEQPVQKLPFDSVFQMVARVQRNSTWEVALVNTWDASKCRAYSDHEPRMSPGERQRLVGTTYRGPDGVFVLEIDRAV